MSLALAGLFATLLAAGSASAAPDPKDVRYAAPPGWALPAPAASQGVAPADAPLRFAYSDTQVHLGPDGEQIYRAYRAKILKPEGLALGNINLAWMPSGGAATVHFLRIIRSGQTIDVLKTAKFQPIQRESGLEQSVLTGIVTATLQTPGLQVGDELEFAATVTNRDPTLGDHAFGLMQLPVHGVPGAFRLQLSWPDSARLVWRATRDLAVAVPVDAAGRRSVTYELNDPGSVIVNDGAPARFNVRRLIEYSDFAGWSDVSKRFWPLYAQASRLAPGSPLRGEVARIAAASPSPIARAEAALRLVEDQIRYVYVGLNGGNYLPASADETWTRRFGDCKAKTALLLALLRELGIEAEPAMVNPTGDDVAEGRLPGPSIFNHVLVRARIAGKNYWLDGTRLGDRHLALLPAPTYRWALPLSAAGGTLEQVAPTALTQPQFIDATDIDASAGFDQPARVKVSHVYRGDEAIAFNALMSPLSAEDANRALRKYWAAQEDWIEPDRVEWRYDDARGTIVVTVVGSGRPDWTGNDKDGRSLHILGAGFYAPGYLRRPPEQDQTATWATDFPQFRCWATTIHLPVARPSWRWAYYADPVNMRLGGTEYWRAASLDGGVVKTIMSRNVFVPEISPIDAKVVNGAIPGFNNHQSSVYEEQGRAPAQKGREQPAFPFRDDQDWVGDPGPCSAAAAR